MNDAGTIRELYHDVPMAWATRGLLIAAGGFVAFIAAWELARGVWPLNATTPFFALIILGSWIIATLAIGAGIFGRAIRWHVTQGSITLEARDLLRTRRFHYHPADIAGFTIHEHVSDDGTVTWNTVMRTKSGHSHPTGFFPARADAEALRDTIRTLFTPGWDEPDRVAEMSSPVCYMEAFERGGLK